MKSKIAVDTFRCGPLDRRSQLAELLADLTIAASVLHTGSAVGRFAPAFAAMARGGGWNTVDPREPEPMAALWFTACGLGLAGVGLMAREAAVTSGHLPRYFGPTLLAIALPVCILQPMTGARILIPPGAAACSRSCARRHHAELTAWITVRASMMGWVLPASCSRR